MRFTEQHEVERPSDADWFDLNTEMDSPLYVDPFLLFDDPEPFWNAGHDEIIDFFSKPLWNCWRGRTDNESRDTGRRQSASSSSLSPRSSASASRWATQRVQASAQNLPAKCARNWSSSEGVGEAPTTGSSP
ncbi:hypothetical protein FV141_06440 [Dermacoccus abyssi]|uniref:Uncharacterized protein n=1 Tax=Dermacoccus abyssi TaxID=322596 RepID=A0ABX5Z8S7_9MICO|nr:hypothetical protein FV141_06440 [Dermacoccus abyssi]